MNNLNVNLRDVNNQNQNQSQNVNNQNQNQNVRHNSVSLIGNETPSDAKTDEGNETIIEESISKSMASVIVRETTNDENIEG